MRYTVLLATLNSSAISVVARPGSLVRADGKGGLDETALKRVPFNRAHKTGDTSMARPEGQAQGAKATDSSWWAPWPVVALIVVTVANYVWQVPYYFHFYGQFGSSPGGLTVPLLLTFAGSWLPSCFW